MISTPLTTREDREHWFAVCFAATGWSLSSVAMSFANKKATVQTEAPLVLTALQMLATTLFAFATCDLHFGSGTLTWSLIVPPIFVVM